MNRDRVLRGLLAVVVSGAWFLILLLILVAFLQSAKSAKAGSIVGTDHDLSATFGGGQVCVSCHAPHNNTTGGDLLWNHDRTTATYTVYSSDTLNGVVGQPGSRSLLCLSCHDGTVAIDSFGGTTGTNFMSGNKNLGTNLSTSHPVGFTFNTALATADGGLYDPSTTNVPALGGTIDAKMLRAGKVECVSCHEPHNKFGNADFLRITNVGSQICLVCHNK